MNTKWAPIPLPVSCSNQAARRLAKSLLPLLGVSAPSVCWQEDSRGRVDRLFIAADAGGISLDYLKGVVDARLTLD